MSDNEDDQEWGGAQEPQTGQQGRAPQGPQTRKLQRKANEGEHVHASGGMADGPHLRRQARNAQTGRKKEQRHQDDTPVGEHAYGQSHAQDSLWESGQA